MKTERDGSLLTAGGNLKWQRPLGNIWSFLDELNVELGMAGHTFSPSACEAEREG